MVLSVNDPNVLCVRNEKFQFTLPFKIIFTVVQSKDEVSIYDIVK